MKVAAIVVPIVIAVVLFSVIFVVIKCTKINRSAGPAGSSPLQPLSDATVVPTIAPSLSPGTMQVDVPPPHSIPLTAPVQLPPSTDHSQGFTNFTVEGEYVQG